MPHTKTPYVSRTIVKAAHAGAFVVHKGQVIAVRDVKGGQVVDFWAIDLNDFGHYASPPYTIMHLQDLQPKVGDQLLTNHRLPALTILSDDVGQHDLFYPACDKQRYLVSFGVTGHRNCHDNFLEVVEDYGWGSRPVPFPPFNLFMNIKVESDGRLTAGESKSKPGDRVLFRAEMDLLCVASACPMDLTAIVGKGVTDIEVQIANRFENLD
jgi:uncharacterized protein